MVEKNFSGWVEMDGKGTLKFWDSPRNNYGLSIDVFDINENQLDARDHFYLQDCEAGKSVVMMRL